MSVAAIPHLRIYVFHRSTINFYLSFLSERQDLLVNLLLYIRFAFLSLFINMRFASHFFVLALAQLTVFSFNGVMGFTTETEALIERSNNAPEYDHMLHHILTVYPRAHGSESRGRSTSRRPRTSRTSSYQANPHALNIHHDSHAPLFPPPPPPPPGHVPVIPDISHLRGSNTRGRSSNRPQSRPPKSSKAHGRSRASSLSGYSGHPGSNYHSTVNHGPQRSNSYAVQRGQSGGGHPHSVRIPPFPSDPRHIQSYRPSSPVIPNIPHIIQQAKVHPHILGNGRDVFHKGEPNYVHHDTPPSPPSSYLADDHEKGRSRSPSPSRSRSPSFSRSRSRSPTRQSSQDGHGVGCVGGCVIA
ncbi:hypothetical protein C8Q75DRAFT_427258 [Abortiporus biennis]|nr:hypothetical protein C8Q75DRAFT_427258 [Abortiporus biennis]